MMVDHTEIELGSLNQSEKLSFRNDPDFVAFCDEFLGAPVLGALVMSVQQGEILVADNQKGDLLANTGFHGDACASGNRGRFGSAHAELAGKTPDMPIKRAILPTFNSYALWVFELPGVAFCAFGQFSEALAGFFFGKQYDLRSSFGVLGGVVVFERQVEAFLEVPQSVATFALELRPCLLGDGYTVQPVRFHRWQAVSAASCGNGLLVKCAVLDQRVALKKGAQGLDHLAKNGVTANCAWANTMQVHVEFFELGFWVNQEAERVNVPFFCHHTKAKLADGRSVRICRFYIDRDKTKRLIEDIIVRRPRSIFVRMACRGRRLRSAFSCLVLRCSTLGWQHLFCRAFAGFGAGFNKPSINKACEGNSKGNPKKHIRISYRQSANGCQIGLSGGAVASATFWRGAA